MHEQDPENRERLLSTLQELLMLDADDVASALRATSNAVGAALGADKVDVFLYEASVDMLVAAGTSETPMGRRQHALGLDRLPLNNGGRAAEVFVAGRVYRCGHVTDDSGELLGIRLDLGVRSSLGVPLDVAGRRRGVLLASSATAERFSDGDERFLVSVARWVAAVTHRAELVQESTRAAAERGQRRAAEELMTVLAHDLRNHLTPPGGRIDMIRRRAEREASEKTLRDATEAGRELRFLDRMIGELLDMTRLDRGLFAIDRQPTDLVDLAQEAADALSNEEVSIYVGAPERLVAAVDPSRYRQALDNLLANAVRYAPAGTAVHVTLRSETRAACRWAVLTVKDEGPGIAPEALPRLFTRFTSAGSMGLGLGLYLAREIATAHGGTLTVDSRLGEGAQFTLALPAKALEAS
jgi:two-component system OmpR family sensor kinase